MPDNKYRRFAVIEENKDLEPAFEKLICEKQLTRNDIALILLFLRIRYGFSREDFEI